MRNIIFLTLLISFLAGCATQEPAPVEYKAGNLVNPNLGNDEEVILRPIANKEYNTSTAYLEEKQSETPLTSLSSVRDDNKTIYHEVQPGETIERLAANYGSSKDEIINLNDLTPPFELEQFQIIKIKVSNEILNKKNREHAGEISSGQMTEVAPKIYDIIKPLEGKIIVKFGESTQTGKSSGINIEAPAGTAVKSIGNGIVTKTGNSTRHGNLVVIKLDEGNLFVAYAHLKDLMLKVDQKISQGEIIGHVGNTGNVSKAQLYLAIKENEKALDPLKYIADLE